MADPETLPVTVLVVEDEEEVRALARDVLEMNGYTVLEALDAEDCMSGYPESPDREIEGAGSWTVWLQKPFTPDTFMGKVRECLTS
ncbi:MAG: hypothetical protein ACREKB_14820 [Candidatus Rokuibacteriota bacterium]